WKQRVHSLPRGSRGGARGSLKARRLSWCTASISGQTSLNWPRMQGAQYPRRSEIIRSVRPQRRQVEVISYRNIIIILLWEGNWSPHRSALDDHAPHKTIQ